MQAFRIKKKKEEKTDERVNNGERLPPLPKKQFVSFEFNVCWNKIGMKKENEGKEKDSLGHIWKNLFRTISKSTFSSVRVGNVWWWFALSSIFSRIRIYVHPFFMDRVKKADAKMVECGRIFVFQPVEA